MQLFIGFDVGGTHIKHGVINENGEELTSDEYDTPDDESTFKQKWKAVVDKYRQEHEIVGIGVSFPGHINHHTGEAAKAGALDYLDGENLCELFAQLTDLPVTTENDANCAALGERWQGAGKDYEHFVCITIGTGIGGGICQVSTTLYNAVLRAELEVTERHNHSMIVTYVDPSADAAIAESSGKDFVFVNNTDYPIYIDGHTADKKITFTIYGVETRAKNRTVAYESEVIEKKVPEADQIIADASQPIGVISVSSAHIGYKARLWKIVKENGVEVSREQVNSSNYKMSPRTATVGIASPDPNATSQMQAAIATSSIDTVKATISNIKAQQAAAAALTPEQLQAIAEAQAQAAQAQQDAAAGN